MEVQGQFLFLYRSLKVGSSRIFLHPIKKCNIKILLSCSLSVLSTFLFCARGPCLSFPCLGPGKNTQKLNLNLRDKTSELLEFFYVHLLIVSPHPQMASS